jgi:hypothetical protein
MRLSGIPPRLAALALLALAGPAAAAGPTIQEMLDAGEPVRVPPYGIKPDVPLFVTRPGATFLPYDGAAGRATISGERCGVPIIVGVRRTGLLTPAHFAGGFRTHANANLVDMGGEPSLGPNAGGWGVVKSLYVGLLATLHSSPTGTWDGMPICGVNCQDWWVTRFGPAPSPWMLHVVGGRLTLSVRTADGVVRHFSCGHVPPAALNLRVSLDLDAGTALFWSAGTVYPTDYSQAGGDWQPGVQRERKLAANFRGSMQYGRCDPYFNSNRYGGHARYDATFQAADVVGTRRDNGQQWRHGGSFQPSPLGANAPLVTYSSTGGTRWLLAAHKDQGDPDNVYDVRIDGVAIEPAPGNPAVVAGRVQGGRVAFEMRDVKVVGGTRGFHSLLLNVQYPLRFVGCEFLNQSDRGLSVAWGADVTVRDTVVTFPGRAFASLLGCNFRWERGICTPPPAGLEQNFWVEGGQGEFDGTVLNYEFFRPGLPPFADYSHDAWLFSEYHPSGLSVRNCNPGSLPGQVPLVRVVRVQPAQNPDSASVPKLRVVTIHRKDVPIVFDSPADRPLVDLRVDGLEPPLPAGGRPNVPVLRP